MSKPILVINPATGQQSYTKHPEKLIERRRARQEHEQLVLMVAEHRQAESGHPYYWNGSGNKQALHLPGEVRS